MTTDRGCRCCGGKPLVDYFGLCRKCSDAVTRFIATRRANLTKRTRGTR